MERPLRVEVAAYLIAAGIVMSLAVAWTTSPPPGFTIFISTNTAIGASVVGLIQAVIVIAFWNRRKWAVWAVIFFSVLWLLHMLLGILPWGSLQTAWHQDWSYVVLMVAKFFLALYLLSSVSSQEVRSWFDNRQNQAAGPGV